MLRRSLDLGRKAFTYSLSAMAQPLSIPFLLYQTLVRGVHVGEIVRLSRSRWFRSAGIQTVVDVGANTGQFASAVRALLPSATIFSFEPLPDCFQTLRRRLERYGRFKGFCTALGDTAGEVTFWRSGASESSSPLPMSSLHGRLFPWTRKTEQCTVRMGRLDDYLDDLVGERKIFLKIDVQGYERNVLLGGREFLKHVHMVLIEVGIDGLYEGQASFQEVYELMRELGFHYRGNLDQLLSSEDGRIVQVDALFARGEW